MKKATVKDELNGAIERLNSFLEDSGTYIKVGHRNGYTALDLHRISDDGCKDNIAAGLNDKGALSYVYSMIKGILLFTDRSTK